MKSLNNNNIKVLFISQELIAGDLAYRLKQENCDVKLFIGDKNEQDCFNGMVEKTKNWKKELEWVGKKGLIIFDDVGYGDIQDKLRKEGYLVVGGSGDGDRLELDRVYAQKILKEQNIIDHDFETKSFKIKSAIAFVKKNKGKWVIKQNDHNTELNYIGKIEDGSDVIDILENYKRKFGDDYFISLQKKVEGVEIAVGRFFNGKDWFGPSVVNFEHKHLYNYELGPLGGETGTVMWYDENSNLFNKTLSKLKLHLQKSNYRGYVDINFIINKNKAYPLEVTSRFGSSTIETQDEIQISPWKDFLMALAKGENYNLKYKKDYAINVALTIPPFPYKTIDKNIINNGMSIYFNKNLSKKDFSHIHYEGVLMNENNQKYYTAGNSGYVIYITETGKTVEEARKKAYRIIDKIMIPKMFYKTDIGLKFIEKNQKLLKKWGWI